MKGYRERIKTAKTLEEAKFLLEQVKAKCPEKYYRRCKRVFDQLPFTKTK